jgi:hypothetical protein
VIYFCCDDQPRRQAVKDHAWLNGIDFIEVSDEAWEPPEARQRTLFVYFLKPLAPSALNVSNVRIDGGERIRHISVVSVSPEFVSSPPSASPPAEGGNVLVVEVAQPGDFSVYTLRLVTDPQHDDPPAGFDPLLSAVDFSFKAGCSGDFDCRPQSSCQPSPQSQPDLNYLAKDYASFRQLMLDRIAVLFPQWKERNPADLGIVLVELLAYVADYLSYQQDAVATEAYLKTARLRTSVRRHALLVDYHVHEGANARVWVQAHVAPGVPNFVLEKSVNGFRTKFLTNAGDLPSFFKSSSKDYQRALEKAPIVFELVNDGPTAVTLFEKHNQMFFYTWGSTSCCLPNGAIRATLRGAFPNLQSGHVLILAEVRGPATGEPEDADPNHRHAVRLTSVTVGVDPLGGRFHKPPDDSSVAVTEIEWNVDDRLPFPLCISASHESDFFDDVSAALGNILLADHGSTTVEDLSSKVPEPNAALAPITAAGGCRCQPSIPSQAVPQFRPSLNLKPVTHAPEYKLDQLTTTASAVMEWPTKNPLPVVELQDDEGNTWEPVSDLLDSKAEDLSFVVEVETDGTAFIRFGDGRFGARPNSGTQFSVSYRVGNGLRGNIGRETLSHLVSDQAEVAAGAIDHIWNPLAAMGGLEPESVDEVRQRAPAAFRVQQRAVTLADYEDVTQRGFASVQRATASFRWTGSWRTAFVSVDLLGGAEADDLFRNNLKQYLDLFRMAGLDLEVSEPVFVPLELEIMVCAKPDYSNEDLRSALFAIFTRGVRPDGRKGLLHPDNFTFGQTVYLSRFYAAAQSIDGVASVRVTKFQRQGANDDLGITTGKIGLASLEIARLDNDPSFPEHGVLTVDVRGGR